MNDKTTAEEANSNTPDAADESTAKEQIYVTIGDLVKEKTGKRIGKTGGREIFDVVVGQIFAAAAKDGSFRFNGGFGSLHLKNYQAGSRRLPSGETTTFGERSKIRYEEGVVTKALVVNGGDLAAVLQERRGTEIAGTADPIADAAAPAASPAASPATEAPASEADSSLDLD